MPLNSCFVWISFVLNSLKLHKLKNGSAVSKPILKAAATESMDSSLFVCFEILPFPFIGMIWKERAEKRELEEETSPWEGNRT